MAAASVRVWMALERDLKGEGGEAVWEAVWRSARIDYTASGEESSLVRRCFGRERRENHFYNCHTKAFACFHGYFQSGS